MHDVNDDATLYTIYTMMMTALGWWLEYTVKTEIDVLWWRDDCFLEVSWQSKIEVLTVIDKVWSLCKFHDDSPSLS